MSASLKKTKKKSLVGKAEESSAATPPADLGELVAVLESLEKDVKATTEHVSELRKRVDGGELVIDKGVSFLDVGLLTRELMMCRSRMSCF